MTADDSSIAQFVDLAGQGDGMAQQQIWDRYFPQLVRLAQLRIQQNFQRIGDAEDVALSVLNSFFGQIQKKSLPGVRGADDLWRLLSRMTQRKAIDWVRHQQRQKRRVLGESVLRGHNSPPGDLNEDNARPLEQIASEVLEPQLASSLIEDCQRLMQLLPEDLRPVVLLRLAGHTNAEIAASQQCSLATVERRVKLVRAIWSTAIADEPS